MTSQRDKPLGQLTLATGVDIGHSSSKIVIGKLIWHPTKLLQKPNMGIKKTDHVISTIGFDKGRLTERGSSAKDVNVRFNAIHDCHGLPPVDLEFCTWRMIDRTEDLGGYQLHRIDQIRDGSPRSFEFVFIAKPFEDSGLGVTLLARFRLVFFKPLLNQRNDRVGDWPRSGSLKSVGVRFRILDCIGNRIPRPSKSPKHLALRQTLNVDQPSN